MRIPLLLAGFFLLIKPWNSYAQTPASASAPAWNSFSLQSWADAQRIQVLDRRGSRYGYISDRGVFQRFTPGMTDEFDLNLFSYGFSLQQDYLWNRNENGYRMYAGRQTDLTLSMFSQFKTDAEVADKTRIGVVLNQEQDARTDRALAIVSVGRIIGQNHELRIFHTLSSYQQDMDAGITYRYGHPQVGYITAEVSALDYLNNALVSSINDVNSGSDTLRYYRKAPFFGTLSVSTPTFSGFRIEAFAGQQSQSVAEIAFTSSRSRRFKLSEKANYQGFMLEYQKNSVTAGLVYTREKSAAEIDTLLPSNLFSQYNSEQLQRAVSAHMMLSSNEYQFESTLRFALQRDTQQGDNFFASTSYPDSLRFEASRLMVRNRIMKRPFFKGLIAGLEHVGDFRAPANDAVRMRTWSNSVHDVNHRITLISGWQFNPRAYITYGFSIDLDSDYHVDAEGDFMDGGFIRLELRW